MLVMVVGVMCAHSWERPRRLAYRARVAELEAHEPVASPHSSFIRSVKSLTDWTRTANLFSTTI